MDEHLSMMDLSQDRVLSVRDRDSTKLLQGQITTTPDWQPRPRQAKWGVNWRAPFKMLGFLVSGVGLAVGHYSYFMSLEGTIVVPPKGRYDLDDQEWHARFGTALAFLVKTCFVAAVAIAYKQSAWLNMRSKAHSVSGLDSMFSGTTDILAFFSLDFMLHAKVAALIAGVTWLMPLSALVAQATLTVVPSTNITNEAKLVPALNFSSPNFLAAGLENDVAPVLNRISSATISTAAILPMDAVYPNSTYDLSFKGPGLNCHNATDNTTISAIDADPPNYGLGSMIYMAKMDPNSSDTLWFKFGDYRLVCELQNTTYRIHTSSADSTTVILSTPPDTWDELDHQDPAYLQGNYNAYMYILTGLFAGTIGVAAGGPAGQTADTGHAFITSQGTNIASTALESLIIDAANDALGGVWSLIIATPLGVTVSAADRALTRNLTFDLLVQELSYNITLSLFSDRRYWQVLTLLRSLKSTGAENRRSKEGAQTIVTTFTAVNRYSFNAWSLVLAYVTAFAISLFCVFVGLRAMFVNGVSHSMSFSTIVAVTRNSTLDHMLVGNSLGAEPMSKDVMAKKLMFGVLRHEVQMDKTGTMESGTSSDIDHASFGLCDEVVRIKRGHAIS